MQQSTGSETDFLPPKFFKLDLHLESHLAMAIDQISSKTTFQQRKGWIWTSIK